MAVQEQTPLQEYTANGITKQFDLEFDCESADHLIVSIDDLEVLHTDWYLSGNAIMFHVAPANGKQVKIQRNTPFNRLADYQSYNSSFRPPAINKDFDRIWWKLQELGVADWILSNRINALKAYVDQQDSELQQNIDNLKIYVDDKDDELRAYLTEEIRKQGVALDQLDEYYNYLMQQLAQIAVSRGWDASFITDAGGSTQQDINDFGGAKWRNKAGGYALGATVKLDNGDIVKSTIDGNANDPNVNMTGWVLVNSDSQIKTWSGRTQESKNKDFLTPEDFGATGGSYTLDTQAFRDMLASPFSNNYLPDPSKTYFINKQLDLGRKSNWLSDLNLQITGQPTDADANLNVQAASSAQHISILFCEGEHYFKNITVSQVVQGSGWRSVLRNDFYLRSGTRPTAYKGIFKAGDIKITSDLPLTNMSGGDSGLIKFRSQHVFEVGDLYLNNAKVVFGLLDIDKSKIGRTFTQNTLQGISASQCPDVSIKKVVFDNTDAIPEFYQLVAGANALLVMGCPNASCGDVYTTKTGEHGVRVLSFGSSESLSGKEYITDLSLQSVKLIQCGGSGFKASPSDSSSVTVKNNVISLQSLYVEDCGSLDYSATAPVGDYAAINVNRYGLNLQNVNDFNCGSFITKKKNKVSNGWHNMLIRDVTNFFIGYAYLADAQAQSVFWNAGSALNPCDSFVINKLVIPNSGLLTAFSTTLPAFFVIAPKYVKNFFVDMDIDNSYSAIAPSGDSTNPLGGWTINITMGNNVTLKTVTYLTDPKYAINTRYMIASKSSGSTQLDFNTTLFAEFAGASVVRLGILDVYLSSLGSAKYVATPVGSAQPANTGARLEGEWRSVGLVGTNILCQRSR